MEVLCQMKKTVRRTGRGGDMSPPHHRTPPSPALCDPSDLLPEEAFVFQDL